MSSFQHTYVENLKFTAKWKIKTNCDQNTSSSLENTINSGSWVSKWKTLIYSGRHQGRSRWKVPWDKNILEKNLFQILKMMSEVVYFLIVTLLRNKFRKLNLFCYDFINIQISYL